MVTNCSHFLAPLISQNIFIALSIAVLFLVAKTFFKVNKLATGMILFGGAYNIVDRVVDGCVADYWNFFGLFHFNIQDVLVTTGMLTLFFIWCKSILMGRNEALESVFDS